MSHRVRRALLGPWCQQKMLPLLPSFFSFPCFFFPPLEAFAAEVPSQSAGAEPSCVAEVPLAQDMCPASLHHCGVK